MLRQFLTLIAVITGLAATAAPAHAAESGVEAVQLALEQASCHARAEAAAPQQLVPGTFATPPAQNMCLRPVLVIATPTVMLQVDRARD